MSEKCQRGCWVRLAGLSGAAAWRWVAEAEPIRLEGLEGLRLYVHRDVAQHEHWAVTEATSGRRVSGRWRTRKEAIAWAAARLAKAGEAAVQAKIDEALEAYGPPPPRPLGAEEEGERREAP